jgi:pyruvate formate-lyase activating enzyme-like uncharacterized protein
LNGKNLVGRGIASLKVAKNLTVSIIMNLPQRREAVGLLAFRERQKDQRHDFMQNLAEQAFSDTNTDRCLVIGVNIDDENWYPYSVLGVFERTPSIS